MSAEHFDKDHRLGRYVLKRPLGEGGWGQVFLAWQDNAAGEPLPCVVKFPLHRYIRKAEIRQRFIHEARLAMRLGSHENIVQVIDVGEHQGMPFIVMQYIDGADLHMIQGHLWRQGRGLSINAIYNIMGSAAAGLRHAHFSATVAGKAVEIVHRDIKPANLLITRDGVTKLADFGIGVTMEEGTTGQHWRGTARYMSPEHLRCEVRPEMDIYSLGVVAWEMVENRVFREKCHGTQHYAAILADDIPPMRNTDAPRQLISLIQSCLDPHPRQRPTASDLLKALAKCPGYSRDPDVVAQEVASVLGTRRSSGATQQELAATPELLATFAVLERLADDSDDVTIERSAVDSKATTAQQRVVAKDEAGGPEPAEAPVDGEPEPAEPSVDVEPDAPRIFRRPWANRVREVSRTVELRASVGQDTASSPEPAKTPPIVPPWDEPHPAAEVVEDPPRGEVSNAAPRNDKPPPEPSIEEKRGETSPERRPPAIRVAIGAAASVAAALVTAGWLGAFDDPSPMMGTANEAPHSPEAAVIDEPTAAQDVATREPRSFDVQRDNAMAAVSPAPSPGARPSSPLPQTDPVIATKELQEPPPMAAGPQGGAAAPTESTPSVEADAPAPPSKPAPPVDVTLALHLVDMAEIKIGRKHSRVSSKTEIEVPAGRHRVRWRLSEGDEWQDAGRQRFAVGHHYFVRVRSSGPQIIDIDGGTQ